jgi:hypothetical protein
MALDPDDLGDAKSRDENRNYREAFGRKGSDNAVSAYLHRWVPTGNRQMSLGDLILIMVGLAIILAVVGMRLFGVIH